MAEANTLGIGVALFLVGLLLFAAARLFLRSVSALQPGPAGARAGAQALPEPSDAVLVLEAGGRIYSLNHFARELFHLADEDTPDLERLARRVRPSEDFIALCAASGQASLTLDGRLVYVSSYRLPVSEALMMVVLRVPGLGARLDENDEGLGAQTLGIFARLSATIASSLDLSETIQAILEGLEKFITADFIELSLWDSEQQDLVVYHRVGLSGTERILDKMGHFSAGEGYSGVLYRDRQILAIPDVSKRSDIRPGKGRMPGLRSFLGIPLESGAEFVGTLELGSRAVDDFQPEAQNLLKLLSGHAAVALHNALVYRQQQRRSAELSGLAQLSQAFSSVRDIKGLFVRLVTTIVPLFEVEILGFLIYNESQRTLEGQIPFHGLPDQFVQLYRAKIPANSPAEQVLQIQDVLIAEDAAGDPQWALLGLEHFAQAASLRDSVLIPITSGGRMLGYLQASNHKQAPGFNQSDLHLLAIVANQAGAIIENVFLMQQSAQRAQRAESLRQIVSLSSSAANLDEILSFAVRELCRLLRAECGAIFLVDSPRNVLQLHPASCNAPLEALPERSRRLMVDDAQYSATATFRQHTLFLGHEENPPEMPAFYTGILSAWNVASLIAVPLVVRNEGVGEIWFTSSSAGFFDQGDVQLVSTAAGHLAGAVDQVFLRTQTDENLRNRLDRLVSVARINRELNNTLDINQLIQLIHAEALHSTGADCGSVLLFDLALSVDAPPVVVNWYGDLHEPGLSQAEFTAFESAAPYRIERFDGEKHPLPHAGVLSELIVPIIHQRRVAGLIVLHGARAAQFNDTDQDVCQSLAVLAAIALGNAMQYTEQNRRSGLLARELDTVAELLQVSRLLRPSLPLEQTLSTIGGAICQTTPFQVNVVSVVDPETMLLQRVCSVGLPADQWLDLCQHTQPWGSVQQLLRPEFAFGSVYYIPANKAPALPPDIYSITVVERAAAVDAELWHPDDFLLVPLYDINNYPLGIISVDAPADGRRPDRPTFEALEIFGIQAALMIEGHRRTTELEGRVAEMEHELGRLQQATGAAIRNLPVYLRKDLEQTVALHAANRRIERVRAALEIAALAGSQENPQGILRMLAFELLTRFALQNALVAVKDAGGVRLIDVIGGLPAGVNPEALFGQRNPLRRLLVEFGARESDTELIANLESSSDWNGTPLLSALGARSAIGLLMNGGGETRFAILALGRRNLPAFTEEDRTIFIRLAEQVGIGLQNRRLLSETQETLADVNRLLDFSLDLRSLQPQEILAALVERALKAVDAAQAGWAGLWDGRKGALTPQAAAGYANPEAMLQLAFRPPAGDDLIPLPLRVLETGLPLRQDGVNFASEYRLDAADLQDYRQATRDRLPESALILPLRLGEAIGGVLMLENFDQPHVFSAEDEALAYSFSQQAALSLDNARLYQSTSQRAAQMQSLTRVSSILTASLKSEELTGSLLDLLYMVTPYQTAMLWMRGGSSLTVRSVRGYEDNAGLEGISVALDESELFNAVVRSEDALVVPDVRLDSRFPSLVEPQNLSWVGLPLSVHGEVVGLVALEGREAGYFTPEQLQAALTFSSQAAVALENARLFEESSARAEEMDQRSQRLALLNRLSGELGGRLDIHEILSLTAQHLLTALGAAGAAGILSAPDGHSAAGHFVVEAEAPARGALPLVLAHAPLLERLRETRGLFSSADVTEEADLGGLVELYCRPRGARALLIIPLISGDTLHGWLMIDRAEPYRFLPAEMELARTVCNQAAAAIQTALLFEERASLTEFLEKRVEERTAELRAEHKNSQTLLRVISELSTSLDIEHVLTRALTVINDSFGAEESIVFILQEGGKKIYRAGEKLAELSAAGEAEVELARQVMRGKATLALADAANDARCPFFSGQSPAYRSVLAAPLLMGEEALGALLLFHRAAAVFHEDQAGLAEATARQLGISINNAELFSLIRDQSENLGSLLREQQIESSRSRAILEAVADGVVVVDDQGRITLYNPSAERILSLKAGEVLGKRLELFNAMLGPSGAHWLNTIRSWNSDSKFHLDETFSDQFELENGSVIAVSLAPVRYRTQFLGTVSIFRDITHEVQVDRLKSDFVANVSHELRTPMTSIKGYVEILLMGAVGEISERQRHFLSIVKANTDRLSVLVNDLLDVSRIEAGRISLQMQELRLADIAEDVVADMRRRSLEENKPMRFTIEAPAGLPGVTGDLERVRQVLGSLVANSYTYTPADGAVEIRMTELDEEVQIDVRDNGIGILPADQARIFERFFRGEDPLVLASAGTGLGLAIARVLVGMHSGRIWFKSSGVRGEGSTFSFTLPVFGGQE